MPLFHGFMHLLQAKIYFIVQRALCTGFGQKPYAPSLGKKSLVHCSVLQCQSKPHLFILRDALWKSFQKIHYSTVMCSSSGQKDITLPLCTKIPVITQLLQCSVIQCQSKTHVVIARCAQCTSFRKKLIPPLPCAPAMGKI